MEDAKLTRTVDPGRFNHTDVKRRLRVLADEEDDERTRDRRDDERDERVENSECLRNLVESDQTELSWYHHHNEHEDEHRVFAFELIEREAECGHRREVTGEQRDEHGDNQTVFEAGPNVDVVAQNRIVVDKRRTRDEGETRHDFSVRPRRVDEHHEERDETDDRQDDQPGVNDTAAKDFFLLLLFRWLHAKRFLFTRRLYFAVGEHTP